MPASTTSQKIRLENQERTLIKLDEIAADLADTRETMIGEFATLKEQAKESTRRLEAVEKIQRVHAERMQKTENRIAYFAGGAGVVGAVVTFVAGLIFK